MKLPNTLIYSDDSEPGFTRRRAGKGHAFYTPRGELVPEGDIKSRLKSLAIPPAYTEVWYCAQDNGHVLATGRDAKRRKQYRYHPDWVAWRNQEKFSGLIDFGEALPGLRGAMDYALKMEGLPMDRVIGAVVKLLDKTAARIGNEAYYQENGTSGLTTLRSKHVEIDGKDLHIEYTAKGAEDREFDVYHPSLAKIVKKLHDLPGQRLFQYRDGDQSYPITSSHVNEWLREKSGLDISAKDFRTWRASQLTLDDLLRKPLTDSAAERKRQQNDTLKRTSHKLGHRPPVCRKHYVHPAILDLHTEGELHKFCKDQPAIDSRLPAHESQLLAFLKGL